MKIAIVMGSISDWHVMQGSENIINHFEVEYEKKVLSAHRMADEMIQFGKDAEKNNISIIIAGAGGAAHLPGMLAAVTQIPVIGVPIKSKSLNGLDSLLSIVQMPNGVPVATVAIDGACNAALLAIKILAINNNVLKNKLIQYTIKLNQDSKNSSKDI